MRKIFTLLILILLLPVTALAAAVDAPQTLYVAGQVITDEGYYTQSGDSWTKSSDTSTPPSAPYFHYTKGDNNTPATLTLSGATIQGGTSTESVPFGSGIYAQCSSNQPVALTIELIGENTITGDMGIYVNAEISADSYGTNATLTITGENNGSLEVSGSNYGIFVKSGTGNASLNIEKATVTSSTDGEYAAGVYVMSSSSATNSPNISLSVDGGSLTASGTGSSDGIWFYVGSSQATGATTSLTVSNNAIVRANGGIKASRVDEPTPSGTGIVFDGMEGTVYGNVVLQEDLEIGEGETLTIPEGSSLTVPEGKTLTNNGTINVESGGNLEGEPTSGTGTVVSAPKITTESLASGTVGAAYSQALQADNAPTLWSITSGSLPDGLNLSGSTISGTPTTAGTSTFTVKAENSAGSDSKEYTLTIQSATVPVTGVKLNTETLELFTSNTATLTATVQPGNATNKNVTWSSNNAEVATVENGKVTAKAAGTATITVTTEDVGKTATCVVQVRKPATVEASGSTNISFTTDRDEFTLTATVQVNGDFLNPTDGSWTWTVADADVVALSGSPTWRSQSYSISRQAFTIEGTGTTTITAIYDDGTYRGSVDFTVQISKPTPPDPISYYNIYIEDVCDGVEVSTSKNVVREGGSVSVYVKKDTVNYTFDNFKVYYKRSYYGGWEELKEGTQPGEYPIKNIWTHIYIKAEGAEEKEDPTGIESIEGVKVYTKDGSLYVQTPQREQVIIVSMSGAVVKNEEQIGLKQYHGLQPGIYIVRVGDKAYKLRLH